MKPTFTRAAFLVVLLIPIQTVLAHRSVVVTVVNPIQNIYVTSTAEPVFVTVTRQRESNGHPAAAASSSPSEAAAAASSSSQSSSPSSPPSNTPNLIIQTSITPLSPSSATEAPVQPPPEQDKITSASITPGTTSSIPSSSATPSSIPSETPIPNNAIVQKSSSQAPLTKPTPTSAPAVVNQAPLTTPTPTSAPAVVNQGNPDSFTIAITNLYEAPVSLALGSNDPGPKPDGNPQATVLGKGSATTYTFPTGWAGRISVGKTICGSNSLIEASFPGEQWNSIDVSYVDGFSVPITCSNNDQAVTGCNLDLWKQGNTCPSPIDNGAACHNTAGDYGPPIQFFKPCEGAAYTYPKDDTATNGSVEGKSIICCIGTSCPKPAKQGSSYKKRSNGLDPSYPAHSHRHHQHLARHQHHHHARSQVHQLVQEAKLRR